MQRKLVESRMSEYWRQEPIPSSFRLLWYNNRGFVASHIKRNTPPRGSVTPSQLANLGPSIVNTPRTIRASDTSAQGQERKKGRVSISQAIFWVQTLIHGSKLSHKCQQKQSFKLNR